MFLLQRKKLFSMALIPIYKAMCHDHNLSKPDQIPMLNPHPQGATLLRGLGFGKR